MTMFWKEMNNHYSDIIKVWVVNTACTAFAVVSNDAAGNSSGISITTYLGTISLSLGIIYTTIKILMALQDCKEKFTRNKKRDSDSKQS